MIETKQVMTPLTRDTLIGEIKDKVVEGVKNSLEVRIEDLQEFILPENKKTRQKKGLQNFYIDLFLIPSLEEGLEHTASNYVSSRIPDKENYAREVLTDEKIFESYVRNVSETFRADIREGKYQTPVIDHMARMNANLIIDEHVKDERTRKAIKLRYGLGEDEKSYNLKEVGKMVPKDQGPVTRERARKIILKGMRLIRHNADEHVRAKYGAVAGVSDIAYLLTVKCGDLQEELDNLKQGPEKKKRGPEQYLDESITILQPYLPTGAFNVLLKAGNYGIEKLRIHTIRDIVSKSEKQLMSIYQYMGPKTLNQIKDALLTHLDLEIGKKYD